MEMDEQVFQEAVEYVKCLPEDQDEQVSNETKLKLYGLYKQATQGDNTSDQPSIFAGFTARAKWSAWEANRGMSCEQAKREYVEAIETLTNGEWFHAGSYLSPSATSQNTRTPASSYRSNLQSRPSSRPTTTMNKSATSHDRYDNDLATTPDCDSKQGEKTQTPHQDNDGEDFDKVLDELNDLLKEDYQRLDQIEQKLSKGNREATQNSQYELDPAAMKANDEDPLLTPSQSATIAAGNQLASFCRTLYDQIQQSRLQQTPQVSHSKQVPTTTSMVSLHFWMDALQQYLMTLKLFLFYWLNRALRKVKLFEESPSRSALYVLSIMFISLWTIHRLRLMLKWKKS